MDAPNIMDDEKGSLELLLCEDEDEDGDEDGNESEMGMNKAFKSIQSHLEMYFEMCKSMDCVETKDAFEKIFIFFGLFKTYEKDGPVLSKKIKSLSSNKKKKQNRPGHVKQLDGAVRRLEEYNNMLNLCRENYPKMHTNLCRHFRSCQQLRIQKNVWCEKVNQFRTLYGKNQDPEYDMYDKELDNLRKKLEDECYVSRVLINGVNFMDVEMESLLNSIDDPTKIDKIKSISQKSKDGTKDMGQIMFKFNLLQKGDSRIDQVMKSPQLTDILRDNNAGINIKF